MKSIGLQEFQYGRIDVRAILPYGQGIWPAIWMLGANFPSSGWPSCGEIDIMELIGSSPNTVHGTIHFGADWTQHNYVGQGTSLPFGETFADEFHVFSIDWSSEGITWYIDDQPFYSVTSGVTGGQPPPPPPPPPPPLPFRQPLLLYPQHRRGRSVARLSRCHHHLPSVYGCGLREGIPIIRQQRAGKKEGQRPAGCTHICGLGPKYSRGLTVVRTCL